MDSSHAALTLLRRNAERMSVLEAPILQIQYQTELGRRLLDEGHPEEAFAILMAMEARGREVGLRSDRLETLQLAGRAARARGWPDSALTLLLEASRLWEADRGVPLDPEWREQRGGAARELFAQLVSLKLEHPVERPLTERTREAFDTLQTYKARTLLERIMGPGGAEPPVLQAAPTTLAELQSEILAPGDLLLDLLLGEEESVIFAVTREECRAALLPTEGVLGPKLRLFHEMVASRPRTDSPSAVDEVAFATTSREMIDLLFSSFADLIRESRRLILVPDGPTNILPISCLPFDSAAGIPQREQPARSFSRVPSTTVLTRLKRDPVDAVSTRLRTLALTGQFTQEGEILPGTKEEVRWLARNFADVTVQLPLPDSTETGTGSLANRLADFDVLHFAAHSDANNQYPWRSSIHLGDNGDGYRLSESHPDSGKVDHGSDRIAGETTILYASEIASWKLPTRLVVLSSCQSAGGRYLSGEGVQGLTSAFLSAGVHAVLATLWPVDDLVTAEFTKQFYRFMGEGHGVSAALRQAQIQLARNPQTADPFYWSGFVLVGDSDLQIELAPRQRLLWLWALAAIVVVVGVSIWVLRRKKVDGES
jgi:CHAT domain-containing protein